MQYPWGPKRHQAGRKKEQGPGLNTERLPAEDGGSHASARSEYSGQKEFSKEAYTHKEKENKETMAPYDLESGCMSGCLGKPEKVETESGREVTSYSAHHRTT